MAISFDIIDKLVRTTIDFWALRPRKFLESVKNNRSRYLSPAQFLLACLILMSALYFISISFRKDLSEDTLKRFPALKMRSDPKVIAARLIVLLIVLLVVYSLLYTLISRSWPIRGKATFKNILYYQFYSLAVSLPFPALDVLLTPFILNHIDKTKSPQSVQLLFVLPVISFISAGVLGYIYNVPGLAKLNNVSTAKMVDGILVWSVLFGCVAQAIYNLFHLF